MDGFPLIGCVFDAARRVWRRQPFTADDIVRAENAGDLWEDVARARLLSPIDHEREPQLKVFLIRGQERDALCVLVNHMICDGSGFKEYLYLLSDLYTKCEEDPGYAERPNLPGPRDFRQLLQNLSLKAKLKILLSASEPQGQDQSMVLNVSGHAQAPMIVAADLEAEVFGAIRRYARERRASVNDMLLTAYARAIHRATGCGDIAIPCPVDLRQYKREGQDCGICNLTGSYWCRVTVRPGESFDDTLQKVSAWMRERKQSDACLKGPMLYHMLFYALPFGLVRKLFEKGSPVPVTSYTNLGELDAEKFRFGKCAIGEAFIATAIKRAPYFQLSVSTYGGRCTLTSSFYGSDEDKKTVSDLLDGLVRDIVEVVSPLQPA
jgi:NRPS condensation-like uncharacterized protein